MQLDQLLNQSAVHQYLDHLKKQGVPKATIERKLASIRRFSGWARPVKQPSTPGWKVTTGSDLKESWIPKRSDPIGIRRLYSAYTSSRISSYLHFAILVLFSAALAVFGYNQIFKQAQVGQAYPQAPSPTTPNRYLSFQARLTDSSDNPITTPTDMRFIIYNDQTASGSARLWEELRYIDPDQDGIFSVTLGTETAIPSTLFSENINLWLGVTVQTDPEATPRQRIATVGYALNAETLQGFPPSASASADQIPVLTQEGDLVLAAASPMVYSSSGTFAIKGQALSVTTATGTNGNITIQPDGTGQLLLSGSTTGTNFIRATDANLTSGHLISGYVGNDTATGDLLNLSSGSSEAEKFAVSRTGNTDIGGNLQVNGGSIGISSDTDLLGLALNTLTVNGTLNATTALQTAGTTRVDSSGNLTNIGTTQLNSLTYTWPGSQSSSYVLQTNGSGTLSWVDPAGAAASGIPWVEGAGILYPKNSTVDLLVGGQATTSAKFAVLNVNNGTPTASVSGTTANVAAYLTGEGNLATTNMAPLTIGGATTGSVQLNPKGSTGLFVNGTGNVGIGTTNPTEKLSVTGDVANTANISNFIATGTLNSANSALQGWNQSIGTNATYITGNATFGWYPVFNRGLNAYATGSTTGGNVAGLYLATRGSINYGIFAGATVANNSATNIAVAGFGRNTGTSPIQIGGFFGLNASAPTYESAALIADNSDQTSPIFLARDNGSSVFGIYDGGNVGIGTTGPGAKLEINTGATGTIGQLIKGYSGQAANLLSIQNSSGTTLAGVDERGVLFSDGGTESYSVYIGNDAGNTSITGTQNTGIGWRALQSTTTGYSNVAVGSSALRLNTTGGNNTALGANVLSANTEGVYNVALGTTALLYNTTGSYNTAVNTGLYGNTTGTQNIGIGLNAGRFITDGATANTTGDYNIFIGNSTKALADNDQNEIVIGYNTIGLGSNTVVLGNSSIVTTALRGNVGIGTTSPTATLDVAGDASASGSLVFRAASPTVDILNGATLTFQSSVGGDTGLASIATLSPAGNLSINGTTTFNSLTYTWPGSQTASYVLQTNGSGTLSWVDPAGAAAGGIYWNQSAGALFPKNSTVDLLVGGQATTSAKFAVLNMNSGTPTASISGSTAGNALSLTGDGTIATSLNRSLLLNPSGGNVGIGTTSPAYALDVVGTGKLSTGLITNKIYPASDSTTALQINKADGTTNVLNVDTTNGRVGIGTTGPSGLLDVSQSSTNKTGIRITGTGYSGGTPSSEGVAMVLGYNASGNRQFWIGGTDNIGSNTRSIFRYMTGALIANVDAVTGDGTSRLPINLGTDTSDVAVGNLSLAYNATLPGKLSVYTEAAKKALVLRGASSQTANLFEWQNSAGTGLGAIDNSGNVGIGTTSPTVNLEIISANPALGIKNSSTTQYTGIHIGNSASVIASNIFVNGTAQAGYGGAESLNIYQNRNAPITFATNIVERMRIDASGNVGIGTTGPLATLDVNGTASASGNLSFSGARSIVGTSMNTLTLGDASTGDLNFYSSSNKLTSSGNLTLAGTTTFGGLTYTWPGSQTASYVLQTNGSGTLSWVDPAGAAAGAIYWNQSNGALFPKNSTVDLLVGGQATSSAKFAVLNMNSGTPTASISGSTAGNALSLTGDGTIATSLNRSLLLNPSGGNVGIGTTSPAYALDVVGTGKLSTGLITNKIYPSADSTTAIQFNKADGTTNVLNVDTTNGRVGIGTAAPGGKLDVNGNIVMHGSTIDTVGGINFGPSAWMAQITSAYDAGSNGGQLIFKNRQNGVLYVETARIDQNGNVGIGTTSPTAKLDVAGDASASGSLVFRAASPTVDILNGATLTFQSSVGGDTGLASIATLSPAGNLSINGTTTFNSLTYTWPGSQTASYVLQTNGSGTLSWVDPAGAAAGGIPWVEGAGILYPKNSTVDLLVGGQATTSAKFAVLNMNSGTPVASISANSGNIATYLTGDGTLATTNRQSLTIGNSSTYNTTGNVLINSNGTGNVGIGTTGPLAKLSINGGLHVGGDSDPGDNNLHVDGIAGIGIAPSTTRAINSKITNTDAASDTFGHYFDSRFNVTANTSAVYHGSGFAVSTSATANNQGTIDALNFTANGYGTSGTTTRLTSLSGSATVQSGAANYSEVSGANISALHFGTGTLSTAFGGSYLASLRSSGTGVGGNITDAYGLSGGVINLNTEATPGVITNGYALYGKAPGGTGAITSSYGLRLENQGRAGVTNAYGLYVNAQSGAATTNYAAIFAGGNVGIGDTSPAALLTVGNGDLFQVNSSGIIAAIDGVAHTIDDVAGDLTLTSNSTTISLNDNVTFAGTTTFNSLTYTWPGSQTAGYALTTNGSGTLSWSDPLGFGWWRQNLGAISPINDTLDLLVGSNATASAKFAVLNVNGTGPATATVSGNLIVMPKNGAGGRVGIRTDNPQYDLDVNGNARIAGATFTDAVYFASGTTYYVDASGTAKFLDLIAADTGNPGLTVGDNSIGYVKIGGSTIYDNAGDLTLDSDSNLLATPDSATISGTLTIGNGTTNTLRPAYGPLSLAYKSAADTWTTGLTLQDTTGNVGIGTTSPSVKLDIASTGPSILSLASDTDNNSTDTTYIHFSNNNAATNTYFGLGDAVNTDLLGNTITGIPADSTITQRANGDFVWVENSSVRMILDTNGQLGIGTTAPGAALEVNGNIYLTKDADRTIQIANSTIGGIDLKITSGDTSAEAAAGNVYIYGGSGAAGNGNVILAHTGSAAQGKVGIGKTTPSGTLDVEGDFYMGTGTGVLKWRMFSISGVSECEGTAGSANMLCWNDSADAGSEMHLTAGGALVSISQATSADPDFAEMIEVDDQTIEPGDIVSATNPLNQSSGNDLNNARAGKSKINYDARVLGIISQNPGVLIAPDRAMKMSDENRWQDQTRRALAVAGRVITKVSTINGSIKVGDPITSSNMAGVGMKATKAGRIVGVAMENYDNSGPSAVGKILVFVNPTYYDPDVYLTDSGELEITGQADNYIVTAAKQKVIDRIGAFAEAVIGKVRAGLVEARTLRAGVITPLQGDAVFIEGNVAISGNATVSGTLTAGAIESSTIDRLRQKIEDLGQNYQAQTATAAAEGLGSDPSYAALLERLQTAGGSEPSSPSANLTIENIDAQSGFFSDYLAVLGETVMTNLKVTGSLSLTSLTSPSGTIDLAGNLVIDGDLTVKGKVDILGDLSAPTASFSSLLAQRLEADEARVNKLTTNELIIASPAIASASAGLPPDASSSASIATNATAGKATLPAGATEYTIYTPRVDADSLVYVTPNGDPQNQVLFVKSKTAGEKFTVAINQALPYDLEFNWWIIRLKGEEP